MARTKSQLARIVLTDVLAAYHKADSIPAEDDSTVDDAYEDVLEELREEGLAYWPENAIPNAVVRAVADIVAYNCSKAFGVDKATLLTIDQRGSPITFDERGKRALRKHIAKKFTGEPVRANYF